MSKIVFEPSQTTHWRNLFANKSMLLGSHNLNEGEELIGEIHGVGIQTIKNKQGKDEQVPVMTFQNAPPMVLNITNTRTIAMMYGDSMDKWVGCHIQIYATKVKAFGQEQMALRIRPRRPDLGVDTTEYVNQLRGAKSMQELQSIFMSIPKHVRNSVSNIKDEMKGVLNA